MDAVAACPVSAPGAATAIAPPATGIASATIAAPTSPHVNRRFTV